MPIAAFYASIGALGGALAALLFYHLSVVRPALAGFRHAVASHDSLIAGGQGSAAGRLEELQTGQAANAVEMQRLAARLAGLENLSAGDVSQIGFVRYNALDDTGSDLSYALALLNRQGDGVVISSIYSRTDTRTFGKSVSGFKPAANASEEEMQAIQLARSSKTPS